MSTADVDPFRMARARVNVQLLRARDDLHLFGPAVVRDERDQPLEYSVLHLSWIAHLTYCWKRGLHAGIFGLSGSAGFLVTLAAWLVGRDPGERVKLVCSGEPQARLRHRAVRGVATSPAFDTIFPGLADSVTWDERAAFVERTGHVPDPVVEVRGASSKALGAAATVLLFDEVVDVENSATEERRRELKRLVDAAWLARLEPGGRALWVARHRNPDDASYMLRGRAEWCWLEQRVRADGSGYEQDVHGAGDDYVAETRADLVRMVTGTG